MLLSITKRFLFVANTKAASTTIEHALAHAADIAITQTAFGKHYNYATIAKRYHPLFQNSGVPLAEYFRFGVIRDPLEWIVSWYNYRRRKGLPEDHPNSCHNISFDQFANELLQGNNRWPYARLGAQQRKFMDVDGKGLGIDYLIPFSRVDEELQVIRTLLDAHEEMKKEYRTRNVSPKYFGAEDVDRTLAYRLRDHYAEDMALFRMAQDGGFGDLSELLRRKAVLPAVPGPQEVPTRDNMLEVFIRPADCQQSADQRHAAERKGVVYV